MADQAFRNTGTLINTRSLTLVRWIAMSGQLATIFIVHIGFGFPLPLEACLGLIMISALVGLWQAVTTRDGMQMRRNTVFLLLCFDTVQLAALLYLTGGILNPFTILLLAPATISATVLSGRETAGLVILVAVLSSLLAVFHNPLPWGENTPVLPTLYIGGMWIALVLATVFVTAYAGTLARQSRQLAEGLAEARLTLEREEQMVSLGSLATAAAHKLGSPLNTITLIAHDLEQLRREKQNDPAFDEDILQLREEVERCRQILAELNEDATNLGQQMNEPQPLVAFVKSLIDERFADIHDMISLRVAETVAGPMPQVTRRPELIHPVETLVDNAAQFAHHRVEMVLSWDDEMFSIQINDDGPGIQSSVLARLGEAYISSRDGVNGHMGLGIFIANTMVRHVQGKLEISNLKGGGASAHLTYPRDGFDTLDLTA
ncbi:MAG: ActS/PrrB/RegB family redox-sensitive histidine kinase [Candidatus Puniceispirillales bacterium]